jgi:hypothetical protein
VITWGKYVTRAISMESCMAQQSATEYYCYLGTRQPTSSYIATLSINVFYIENITQSKNDRYLCLVGDTPSVHGIDDATFYLFANHFLPAKGRINC